jgi:glutamine amidotransferase
MMRVAVVDCGSGNLRSVVKALERAAADCGRPAEIAVTAEPDDVRAADRVVLPGVGAFRDCRAGLGSVAGLESALSETVNARGRPFLGICVGMQLMASRSLEFAETEGLGWIPGTVRRIAPALAGAKVPHMGWNAIDVTRPHALLEGLQTGDDPHAYFVHSYELHPDDRDAVVATTDYGGPIVAAVARDNLAGTQFHPEKSQALGRRLLANFLAWRP